MASPNPAAEPITFSFGKNWETFVSKCFSPERLEISKNCIASFLDVKDLRGRTFVDVGCGSGLSSLAAVTLGAERVLSFDVDPHSVAATNALREAVGTSSAGGEHWTVTHGSVLDDAFVRSLGTWDIVYSWGVLHHTGRMWDALRSARLLMKPDSLFFVALYTTDHASEQWLNVKKRYNRASPFKKKLMEWYYVYNDLVRPNLFAPQRALRRVREYKKSRGMDYMTDVRDWLGGYPYEFARVEEVLRFGVRELDLRLVNLKTGEACTEYLFAGPEYRGPRPFSPG